MHLIFKGNCSELASMLNKCEEKEKVMIKFRNSSGSENFIKSDDFTKSDPLWGYYPVLKFICDGQEKDELIPDHKIIAGDFFRGYGYVYTYKNKSIKIN